jgi:hypothetical protein
MRVVKVYTSWLGGESVWYMEYLQTRVIQRWPRYSSHAERRRRATPAITDTIFSVQYRLELGDGSRRDRLARCLGAFAKHLARLVATKTTSPLTTLLFILVRAVGKMLHDIRVEGESNSQVCFGRTDERSQLPLVLALDIL